MITSPAIVPCGRSVSLAGKAAVRAFAWIGLLAFVSVSPVADAAEPSPQPATSLPLITPFNFDPADPGEYSRRAGLVSPGCVATGRIWNRPLPRVHLAKPQAAERLPALEPQARQLGKSVLGLPIVGHFFGVTGSKTLIFAAIHGDEPNTAFVANQLVESLTQNPAAYAGRRVVVVPVVNPDGLARGTRINAREIDLNRNFPAKNFTVGKKGRYFGGEQPASEPESQLVIQLIDDWQPDRIISMHAITRGKHGNNFDGPAEELAKLMSGHNEYSVLKSIGYPTPGSFGSWAGLDHQIPTITLELPSDAAGPIAWRENREALLSAIQAK
jgi:protein MpaA